MCLFELDKAGRTLFCVVLVAGYFSAAFCDAVIVLTVYTPVDPCY